MSEVICDYRFLFRPMAKHRPHFLFERPQQRHNKKATRNHKAELKTPVYSSRSRVHVRVLIHQTCMWFPRCSQIRANRHSVAHFDHRVSALSAPSRFKVLWAVESSTEWLRLIERIIPAYICFYFTLLLQGICVPLLSHSAPNAIKPRSGYKHNLGDDTSKNKTV